MSALNVHPVQIKMNSIQDAITDELTYDVVVVVANIAKEHQALNFQTVTCYDAQRQVEQYLQFQIPHNKVGLHPKVSSIGDQSVLIEHALPFASQMHNRRRPPREETMREPWKKAVNFSPEKRRDRSNHIAHSENNLASLQRASSLIEVAFVSKKQKFVGTCERSSFPLLFVNGLADVQDCLAMYVKTLRTDCPFREAIESSIDRRNCATGPNLSHCREHNMLYGLKINCTSLHPLNVGYIMPNRTGFFVSGTVGLNFSSVMPLLIAFCLFACPKVRPDTYCIPRGNFQILVQIPIREDLGKGMSRPLTTTPTPLGTNPTQVVDLPDTAESIQEENIASPEKKTDGNEGQPFIFSSECPLPTDSHLPAVRISDDDCEVQPTAEWTHPPPGLESRGGKDNDPIESFSRSPSSYHQQQNNASEILTASVLPKNSSQFPLPPIVEDDDESQIASALSAISLRNQKESDKKMEERNTSKEDKRTRQHPYLRGANLQTKHNQREISQVLTGSTIEQLLFNGGDQQPANDIRSQPLSGNRRSKSADWNSTVTPKKSKKLVSSRSCPPSRIRFSPGKEVFKIAAKGGQNDREFRHRKVEVNQELKDPICKGPLARKKPLIRRAGQANTISSFLRNLSRSLSQWRLKMTFKRRIKNLTLTLLMLRT